MPMNPLQIFDLVNQWQDRANKGAASNPQQNSTLGYTDNGLTGADQQIYDKDGNIVHSKDNPNPSIAKQYNAAKQGNYSNSPYVPYSNALANSNPQMADWVAHQNNAQNVADLQRTIGRTEAGKDYQTLSPNEQSLFPNQQNAITTTGGNFTAPSLIGTGTDIQRINQGLPQITASTDVASNIAQSNEAANRATEAAKAYQLGNPQLIAGSQNIGLQNDIQQQYGLAQRIPYLNNSALIGAQAGSATAPYDAQAQEAGAIGGLYQAEHPLIATNPFAANININPNGGSLGNITPGRYLPASMSSPAGASWMMNGGLNSMMGGGITTAPSGNQYPVKPQIQQPINPLIGSTDYHTDEKGQLYRSGIPVDDNTPHGAGGSWLDNNQAHKPLTTGQRLLQGIPSTIGTPNSSNPNSRSAMMSVSQSINNRQSENARIQQLTSILTNPPKHYAGKAGVVSDYTHDQLQDMADELDKLLGE